MRCTVPIGPAAGVWLGAEKLEIDPNLRESTLLTYIIIIIIMKVCVVPVNQICRDTDGRERTGLDVCEEIKILGVDA